ncbi:MAG: ParB/RepB/Spo0J family partition protein [Deltaproteobacteria bacterium]|nr:ParB/RepB/Spo0J family partition protein [Candidatus Anaeroferrophillacea bacterium]
MTSVSKKATIKRGLGRGLGALLPEVPAATDSRLIQCPLSFIEPDAKQPRKRFDADRLAELTESIREKGVVQPVLVRPAETAGRYKLVAGERRWRAAQRAGLTQIPALIVTLDERQAAEVSLIENLQREDLNPLEEARGYRRLIDEFSFSHEEVAKTIGRERSTITNMLRLLQLPEAVRDLLEDGSLGMGHGRALMSLDDAGQQAELAARVVSAGLSVRQVEKLVRDRKQGAGGEDPRQKRMPAVDESRRLHGDDLCRRLESSLGARVRLNWRGREKGRLEIEFHSDEELQRICERLQAEGERVIEP